MPLLPGNYLVLYSCRTICNKNNNRFLSKYLKYKTFISFLSQISSNTVIHSTNPRDVIQRRHCSQYIFTQRNQQLFLNVMKTYAFDYPTLNFTLFSEEKKFSLKYLQIFYIDMYQTYP